MKRRRGSTQAGDRPPKRPKETSSQCALATSLPVDPAVDHPVDHPVLRCLYPEVLSLRHYVLSRLPGTSKNRRRKISQLGQSEGPRLDGLDSELARLLDSALVGANHRPTATSREEAIIARDRDIISFSQQLVDCATGRTFTPGYFQQGEVRLLQFPNSNVHPLTCICVCYLNASKSRTPSNVPLLSAPRSSIS
jgi:hypothetical protein